SVRRTPTRPCIHQSQATIPPPSRLHTPRHYSVSAQVSAIPLRRRVVVELWWYEGALAPVDPQHRTGGSSREGISVLMRTRAPPIECALVSLRDTSGHKKARPHGAFRGAGL